MKLKSREALSRLLQLIQKGDGAPFNEYIDVARARGFNKLPEDPRYLYLHVFRRDHQRLVVTVDNQTGHVKREFLEALADFDASRIIQELGGCQND